MSAASRARSLLQLAMEVGRPGWRGRLLGCLASLAMVAAAAAAGAVLHHGYGIRSPVLLMFLLAVLISATRHGLLTSLLACLCSAAAFDFFFLEPLYTFSISRPEDLVAFAVFCAVAVAASEQAARLREQTRAAQRRTEYVAALYRLGGTLAGCLTRPAAVEAVLAEMAATLEADARFLPVQDAILQPGQPFDSGTATAPHATADEARVAGACTLAVGQDGSTIRLHRQHADFSATDRSLAGAMIGLLDLSLARVDLGGHVEQARIAAAKQALTTTLLDSISHDLRSPLAGILAAAETLCAQDPACAQGPRMVASPEPPSASAAFAASVRTIRAEAGRLNRLAGNLLNMLRLDGGHLAPRLRIEDVADVINAVAARSAPLLARHRLRLLVRPALPWVRLDHALFEPVLFNLLDNAAKFAPAGSVIELGALVRVADSIDIYVRDEGPGLPPAELDRVFEKFVRLPSGPAARAGTGLGLSICRGFVAAMGGSITAANRADRPGTVITVRLPAVALARVAELSSS